MAASCLALEGVASSIGVRLAESQVNALAQYLQLLAKWNKVYNLSAVREPDAMLTQHIADCLAVVPALRRHLHGTGGARLADVGSGGGLPGVVLAVMQPDWQVICIDAVAKKCAFIRQAAAALGLPNITAHKARVEELAPLACDIVISRAFASLADFTRLTREHLGGNGVWLAMKGKAPSAEIASLPPEVEMFHVEQLHVPDLGAERCLVWMRPRAKAFAGQS